MTASYAFAIVVICSVCTILTRALPFFLFGGKKQPPAYIRFLGKLLPYTVMAILVVYCLKATVFTSLSGFLPQFLAVSVTVLLHLWKRNNLISICGGTVCYMLLTQFVF